jgi:hypothetical protein
MDPNPAARATALIALALAYLGVGLWIAATGAGDLLQPLALSTAIGVPLATGLIVALAWEGSRPVVAPLSTLLLTALVAASVVTLGWFPIAYFGFVGLWMLPAAITGAIVGSFIPGTRMRALVAIVAAAAPALLGRFETVASAAGSETVVTSRATASAPAADLWEEIIGADSLGAAAAQGELARAAYPTLVAIAISEPKPLALRTLVFADTSRVQERVVEWEDGDRLRVVAAPQTLVAARGLAAWRAGWGEGAVVSSGATYDLSADGDSTSELTIAGSYRLAVHASAYPAVWVQRVAQTRNDLFAAALQRRAELRARAEEPLLTAEMRMLRAQLLADFMQLPRPILSIPWTVPVFVNGDRAVEVLDESRPAPNSTDEATRALRESLRPFASRARTTAWYTPVIPAAGADGVPVTAGAVFIEFEDYLGHCVAEMIPLTYTREGRPEFGRRLDGPNTTSCTVDVMSDRARRSRLIAQLSLSAGKVDDNWSVALAARGIVRVYADSVVIRADTLQMRANPLDGTPQHVDSVVAALSMKTERAWLVASRGSAIALDRTFQNKEEWSQSRVRFSIPLDAGTDLATVWPMFEVILSAPKTAENVVGKAWTYAHTPMAFFEGIRR